MLKVPQLKGNYWGFCMSDRGAQPNAMTPRVWVISAYRAGEQSQLLALAEGLQLPYQIKPVRHRWQGGLINLFRGTGLASLHPEDRAQFCAPWPDLVIAAGMKNEPVCRWIRAASGGQTRIVHVGRPWADPAQLDLVITTPQYRLPCRPNVIQNALTMHGVARARLDRAVEMHRDRLAKLPAPHIAVIMGGDGGPYRFGATAARRLACQASDLARSLGGSLLISSSARTPSEAVSMVAATVDVPHEFYRWRPHDPDNPYFAYLGFADHLVVSFDSISMLSEACATGKPVYMFDLAKDHGVRETTNVGRDTDLRAFGYRLLMRFGPQRLGRDIGLVHQRLLAEGKAHWLGEGLGKSGPFVGSPDLEQAAARIHQLLETPSSTALPFSSR